MSGPLHLSSTLQAAAHRQRQHDLHRQRREQQGMVATGSGTSSRKISTGSSASSKAWARRARHQRQGLHRQRREQEGVARAVRRPAGSAPSGWPGKTM